MVGICASSPCLFLRVILFITAWFKRKIDTHGGWSDKGMLITDWFQFIKAVRDFIPGMWLWKSRCLNCRWDTETLMKEIHNLREQRTNYKGFLLLLSSGRWGHRSKMTLRDRYLEAYQTAKLQHWGFFKWMYGWDACPKADWESKFLMYKASTIWNNSSSG